VRRRGDRVRQPPRFFEAQLLGVDEAPDLPIINLDTAFGEFGHMPAQGEVFPPRPLQQLSTVPRPDFDCGSTFLPSRKTMQRKPSHFGSYCHCLPTEIWSTDSVSIGLNSGHGRRAIAGLKP